MKYNIKDVVYEQGNYWVLKLKNGYEVYKLGISYSTRCARIGYTGDIGLNKAKAEIDRRCMLESI